MGKRLTAGARREQLLDAAARVFAQRGFEATRMDDIADEAGVAKGLLYKHFPSKDALFEFLVDRQGRKFVDALRDALAGAPSTSGPRQLLERGFELWVEQAASERPEFNFVDTSVHDAYDTLRDRVRDEILAAFVAFEPSAEPEATRLVAAALQGAAESLVLEWKNRPGGIPKDDVVQLLAQFCWEGLQGLRVPLSDSRGN